MGPADSKRAIEACAGRNRGGSRPCIGVWQSCVRPIFSRTVSRSGEHASARLRAQAGNAPISSSPIQHRGAKGRPGADGPGSQVRPGESAGRNTGWPTQEALALARSGRLQAARRSSEPRRGPGPAREGNAKSAASYLAARAVWEAALRECRRRKDERHGGARTFQGPGRRIRRRPCPGSFGRLFPIGGARRRFRKALPGRYFCEIYLRAGSSRVSRTGAGQARRQRGAAGNRSSV